MTKAVTAAKVSPTASFMGKPPFNEHTAALVCVKFPLQKTEKIPVNEKTAASGIKTFGSPFLM